jgi:predicted nuclease with TOPRIM domain
MASEEGAWVWVVIATGAFFYVQHDRDKLKEENKQLHEQVEQLDYSLSNVRSKASELSDAQDRLKLQMSRFNFENWRDVVPDAQAALQQTETAQTDLNDAANN